MSQYTHIFVEKQGAFIEISCTSRSCVLSQIFADYAPWEKIREVTYEDLQKIYSQQARELVDLKHRLHEQKKRIAVIASFNNSIDEKLDAWRDIDEGITENKDNIAELEAALCKIDLLKDIAYQSQLAVKYDHAIPVRIYAGCECGSDVTVEDIEK